MHTKVLLILCALLVVGVLVKEVMRVEPPVTPTRVDPVRLTEMTGPAPLFFRLAEIGHCLYCGP